ncbi:YcaO-like family protein [Luteibacter sp. ME-Dv--P-043b]|uniref:YcaO-like family protein n=1 Tax=Luteibacter sp. ME-Dv--P-043b TaxID=3040291 RepID=UPI00255352D0|nr:YcaO-like family protein [Luteibacter sp. ME-Dv--P-043b]
MANATLPFERDVPLGAARRRIDNELAARGLRWHATEHGSGPFATVVQLSDDAGRPVCRGVGKGDRDSALVGGLFEAFEHFISLHDDCSLTSVVATARDVTRGLGAPIDALLDAQPEARLAVRRFTSFHDGSAQEHPLALFRPTYIDRRMQADTFDYSGLRRYAGNSGTAIGSTFTEAALHALNECIERDDVSHFLRVHFHDADAIAPVRVIDRSTLDPVSTRLWNGTEDMLGYTVTVLDIGTHRAAYSYLAFTQHAAHPVQLYGAGASGCPGHALSRALHELVQLELLARAEESVLHQLERAELRLRPWPRAHRACVADLPALLRKRRTVAVPLPTRLRHTSPRALLTRALHRLAKEGYRPLLHVIHAACRGVVVCQVLVPGFDRYFLVAHGNPIVPGFPAARIAGHE